MDFLTFQGGKKWNTDLKWVKKALLLTITTNYYWKRSSTIFSIGSSSSYYSVLSATCSSPWPSVLGRSTRSQMFVRINILWGLGNLSHMNWNTYTTLIYSYSSWFEIIFGVPQGAILGPILLKIFLADLFFILKEVDIANFDNNNTPYTSSKNTDEFIESLEKAPNTLFQWFTSNLFKGNPDKSHLIVKKKPKN